MMVVGSVFLTKMFFFDKNSKWCRQYALRSGP